MANYMNVIAFRTLKEYGEEHADAREPLSVWFKVAKKASWRDLDEVQDVYPQTDSVGELTVFNIKGNDYRLIVYIDYLVQTIFIKDILTHAEYDKGRWKK